VWRVAARPVGVDTFDGVRVTLGPTETDGTLALA
jgi:hypothetical protein